MRTKRLLPRASATLLASALLVLGLPVLTAHAAETTGKAASASSSQGDRTAAKVSDGDQNTYWESSTAKQPQWAEIDLGAKTSVDQVVLKVPAGWNARKQTLAVQGSLDGTGFSTIVSSAEYSFDPKAGNTVKIAFAPTVARVVRVEVTANTGSPSAQLSELEAHRATASTADLAAATTLTASSGNSPYVASNANDGNQASYWESANNAFPQWIQADLGASLATNRIVLKLPSGWETRTQTLKVQGSANGSTFADLVASAGYVFNPATGNTVTISFDTATTRYVRLALTANTGWPAGQLSEFEVYGPATGDTQAPTAPANLSLTQPGTGQIKLTWNAATDNVGVSGYDVYANNTLRSSVAGNVLTYTDSQPDGSNVSYYIRAKDAAGNQSPNSNTVTRTGTANGANLAVGKAITASSTTLNFVAANANDNTTATYWEAGGGTYPNLLTVALGANADVSSVVLKLNPDGAWSTRTQTIEVQGREQSSSAFTTLTAAAVYTFDPASGNTVTIPVSGRAADVRLRVTSNSGAGGGQVAEFQVLGVPGPNPDLVITGMSTSPTSPVETDPITLSATVKNIGTAAAGATDATLYLGTAVAGTAPVGALAAGASTTVSVDAGPRDAGTYPVSAKVDESNKVIEQNDANNSFTSPSSLVVTPVASSDLVASPVAWSPNNPAAGNAVNFSVAIKNQGSVASGSGSHAITLTVIDATSGAVVKTLTGAYNGTIAAGSTTAPVNLGSWTAVNGKFTVKTVLANDSAELPVKQANNTSSQALFVGRGANMPYDTYEAEDGVTSGGASVVGPNRTIGDLAGEASGRKAVTLNSTGSSVEFTTRATTNTLVTRFSIPDSAGGGGLDSTLNVYVNGTFLKAIDLTSKYSWLYGAEAGPGNSPGSGGPRHIYDEASLMLGTTVPAGSKIKLQKDAANTTTYAIDFVSLEQVAAIGNPDPAKYAVPTGFGQQDVQNAIDKARQDSNLVGVYLPPGDYQTSGKFQVYGKVLKIVGAGPWFTRFFAPSTQDNTDIGFRADATANGSTFSGFGYFGNYTSRIDGPGKVFDFANVANMTIDNIWTEHMVCMYWGANTDNVTISNSRIRDTFADGVNMTNGSTDNHVTNNEARSTGDDSFALFSAIDAGGADEKNNLYENLTSILTWRAAGVAVYGGFANTFRNMYIADTLTYAGITISSLDFGYPMNGFGTDPTNLQNISLVRTGGHFWGGQTFPGIWVFSASKVFQGIRVSDVDIVDPTYSGVMFQTNYVGGQPQFPIKDTIFTNVSITGAQRSGDAFDAKSGFGLWANELPEAGQGPAVGTVTFNNLRMSNNFLNVKNTTSTFTIVTNP
ncbi:discoidin domain-containing protein [Amycolatopsis sp. H20-H5]|uniref:discoidin domain-containing protein n=1 Tax=Amycolatopsis sp. H20-H5 TaxID=3046309 RepID=UPI002DBC756B|nr:discoidin domain-containing protein [Amycolatopsis sp. H20-H5]MEC3978408.1 discoidin domain-containing protein [Amycolatopsis sp. H20-H5]